MRVKLMEEYYPIVWAFGGVQRGLISIVYPIKVRWRSIPSNPKKISRQGFCYFVVVLKTFKSILVLNNFW